MKKLVILLLLGIVFIGCTEQKTAYVDTTRLIQDYSEMKNVETEFSAKSEILKSQLDSVAKDFQTEVQNYQENMNSMSESQRQAIESELMQKQQMLQQQQQMRSGNLRDESEEVVDSIVAKVKEFVKDYGERNNYTYIFGSNESANIMYAKEGLDITDEILEELNKKAGKSGE